MKGGFDDREPNGLTPSQPSIRTRDFYLQLPDRCAYLARSNRACIFDVGNSAAECRFPDCQSKRFRTDTDADSSAWSQDRFVRLVSCVCGKFAAVRKPKSYRLSETAVTVASSTLLRPIKSATNRVAGRS